MRVGIIGLGLIGKQRLQSLTKLQETIHALEIVGYVDPFEKDFPNRFQTLEELLIEDIDILFVAVPHSAIYSICESALVQGVRVHVEKPLGVNYSEAQELVKLDTTGKLLTVGFNYRFFRGVAALLHDIANDRFGDLIRVDFVIGHGGSPSDIGTWKLDPIGAGGGSMLDPGVHLVDLLLLITDDPIVLLYKSWKGFWSTGIDEESNVVLSSTKIPIITITSSIVRWKSEFMIRAIGVDGYGVVTGRGRSYGPQRYVRGERWGWQNHLSQTDSEVLVVEDDCEDSFEREIKQLIQPDVNLPRIASSQESLKVMQFLSALPDLDS